MDKKPVNLIRVIGVVVLGTLVATVGPAVLKRRLETPPESSWHPDPASYRPRLELLGWTPDGDLLLRHSQEYWSGDVGEIQCGGSGIYLLRRGGRLLPVVTGEAWCSRAPERVSYARRAGVLFAYSEIDERGLVDRYDLRWHRWYIRWPWRHGVNAYVSRVAATSDGRRLAVAVGCATVLTGDGGGRVSPQGCKVGAEALYLIDPDGEHSHRVGLTTDYDPAWSPDDRHLLVGSDGKLVVIDTATAARRIIANGREGAWSPDGSRIAYVGPPAARDGYDYSLRSSLLNGTGVRTLWVNDDTTGFDTGWGRGTNGVPYGPSWSPDGGRVFFARFSHRGPSLWSVAADGTDLRRELATIPAVPDT